MAMRLNGGREAPGDGARVLIGFADALAAPETAWSLADAGYRVIAFAREHTNPPIGRSRAVELVTVPAPESDLRACVDGVSELADAAAADAVMPLDDVSLFVLGRAASPVPMVGPAGSQAALALDKGLQVEAAATAGFSVPETLIYDTADEIPEALEYPVVVKPALAVRDGGDRVERPSGHVCANTLELAAAAKRLAGTPVLVQPFIRGVGEGVFGLAQAGTLVACSGHRRIRMANPQGSGSSACVSVSVAPPVAAAVSRLVRTVGWNGLFMVELLRGKDGEVWFVELNGRAWGSMALARRMGFEYPAWAARQTLDASFTPDVPESREAVVCRHLGREIVHLMTVFKGPKSTALVDWPSRWSTVTSVMRFRRQDAWYNWRRDERDVFVADALSTVGRAVARGRVPR